MGDFDSDRKGTGTAEWAEVNENICRGCQNMCLYCYAAYNANRFGQRDRENWGREELTKRPFVTDTIWIGKMNKARLRVPPGHDAMVSLVEIEQRDDEIMDLYTSLKDDPMIRWKDNIKAVVESQKQNIVPHYEAKQGQPCSHPGCANHVSHPCEECGRIAIMGDSYQHAKIPVEKGCGGE